MLWSWPQVSQYWRYFLFYKVLEMETAGAAPNRVTVVFIDRDGDRIETEAKVGDTLLDVAQKHDVELEAKVTFILRDGSRQSVDAKVGDNLLDVILEHDVDIDGFGACEGTLACSTCHLIFSQEDYDKLPSKPTDEELDMLDLAFGLEDTSRLGCQVIVTKDLDGMVVTVPQGVADARSGPL
ncbi:adrenodoxin, mitochondrial [Plakobranchus ocellatus]|uniref:Adrenodoxin, mitochondrial n=1 Tax=Plakobranchus ocellatus TaxID=259542 RepID=A0AAV4B752_9GAST|nr:adrenodoxin, mitochondrial [Plakobranchus ocellatus]